MIDTKNLVKGTKFGSKYTFNAGVFGTFSGFSSVPSDGRKIKDPLPVDGSYFETRNCPDPKMVKITSKITMATYRTFDTTDTVLSTGIETKSEQVDLSLYKSVIDFSSAGVVALTAIPKDQLFVTKDSIVINDYVSGLNTITLALTNAFCKFAISLDGGTTFKTYNSTTNSWVVVDLTQDTATLKTAMSDYTVLNALKAADYAAMTLGKTLDIALLVGIDGTDTTKSYSVDGIAIDYVGTDDLNTTQYFNWVFAGYEKNGNPKFYADRVLQKNISYSTLYSAKVVDGYTKASIANSEIGYDMYLRLPITGIGKAYPSEYDAIIADTPRTGKTIEEFWNTNIGSLTANIAVIADTAGTAAGTTNVISRGGATYTDYTNVVYTSAAVDYGFRPVLIVDISTPALSKPKYSLPLVSKISDLALGKAILCEYTGFANTLGTFANLGTATKGLLNDFNNPKPDGSFAFIFCGYTKEGKIKLMADRVIHTDISLSDLYTGKTPLMSSGYKITIDGAAYTLKLPTALSDKIPASKGGEYDALVSNRPNPNMSIEDLWHTAKSLTLTSTLASGTINSCIVKGLGEENLTGTNQRAINYQNRASNLGFRPILIVEPAIRVDGLTVTPYTGYERQDYAKNFIVDATVIRTDGTVGRYALVKKTNGTVLSPYSFDTERTLDVTLFDNGVATTVSIVEESSGKSVYDFDVYRDRLYRSRSDRLFGRIYSGWGNKNISISTDAVGGVGTPLKNYMTQPTANNGAVYVDVNSLTSKVTFG